MGQPAQMADQIEYPVVRISQAECVPAGADDEIGLAGALLAKQLYGAGAGEVTVGDADFPRSEPLW